jgi:hypothetical protein
MGLMRSKYFVRQTLFSLIGSLSLAVALIAVLAMGHSVMADECPEEPQLQNYTGTGAVACPCFVSGEEAGAVLEAPAEHYPIEILRVGIGWASQFGGAPQSIEQAIHIYDAGLPNPGTPIFTLEGPVLNDGYINVFDLEPILGEIVVDSGPFTVTLEFLNSNMGDPFAPTMFHDGNGCQSGKNVVYAIPGGWYDACVLGVSGDWVVFVIYRQVNCGAGVDDELVVTGSSAVLVGPQPNPFSHETLFEFVVMRPEHVELTVYDVRGHVVATLADGTFSPGRHAAVWTGNGADGRALTPGVYFALMKAGPVRSARRVVLSK